MHFCSVSRVPGCDGTIRTSRKKFERVAYNNSYTGGLAGMFFALMT